MSILYTDLDPYCCNWMRHLIENGDLPHGDVINCDIADLVSQDLGRYTQVHLFAGIGGWALALTKAGITPDMRVWTASAPCQPFSKAGSMRGILDPRHLWPYASVLIRNARPDLIFGEQTASAPAIGYASRRAGRQHDRLGDAWFDHVSCDLEDARYAVAATVLSASVVGAPHQRDRLYFVAHSDDAGPQGWSLRRPSTSERIAGARGMGGRTAGFWGDCQWVEHSDGDRRAAENSTFPVAYGIPPGMGRGGVSQG